MSLTVKPVSGSKGIKAFIDFQHELYAGDTGYVPELYLAQKEMFDTKKYPFYEFGEVYPFIAYRDDKAVGRIVAIVNNRYNEFHKSNVGTSDSLILSTMWKLLKHCIILPKKSYNPGAMTN